MDWQRVPQAWSSSCKTPVAETVIGTSDDAQSTGWLKKSMLLTQYNSLLFFEPPCISVAAMICARTHADT